MPKALILWRADRFSLSLCGILLLLFTVSFHCLAETRDFTFEQSNPEHKKLTTSITPQIRDAQGNEDYMRAAVLSENLLSDYETAIAHLKQYLERRGGLQDNWRLVEAGWSLARCFAHTCNFTEAEQWLEQSQEVRPSSYWYEKTKEEIEQCRHWLPLLKERTATYRQNPSGDNYLSIIRVYKELDEYGFALASIEQMRRHYPNHPWFKTEEFSYFYNFLTSYVTAEEPREELPPPQLVEKTNPQVAALFEELHKIEAEVWESCRKKWEGMSTIEKAKFVNGIWAQQPPMGFHWEPSEAKAQEFLRQRRAELERRHLRANVQQAIVRNMYLGKADWEAEMIENVREYLTTEEKASCQKRQTEVLDKLAALGKEAIPDLIATLQDGHWDSLAGYEARWATTALSKMGRLALPALTAAFEDASKPTKTSHVPQRTLEHIIKALADMKDPATIPILREALKGEGRQARCLALEGLYQLEGGLTEELLLELWQDGDYYIRDHAAGYLERYGGEKTIAALERDLPTAYAKAAYEIQDTIWHIKKRLGQDPGPEPVSPGVTKKDTSLWWAGVEKSLKSPNPGIRITALKRVSMQTGNPADIESFLKLATQDPVTEVRETALEEATSAFRRLKMEKSLAPELATKLDDIFLELVQRAMRGDAQMRLKILGLSYFYRDYDKESYFPWLCTMIIEGMQSDATEYRAQSIFAFVRVFADREDLLARYLRKEVRPVIEKIVGEALDSDYGRLRVDALSAVEILKIKAAQEKLLAIAQNDEGHHRNHALRVLEAVGDASAIPALTEIAKKDPHRDQWGLYDNREQTWRTIKKLSATQR